MIILFLICPPSILFNSHEVVVVFFFYTTSPISDSGEALCSTHSHSFPATAASNGSMNSIGASATL